MKAVDFYFWMIPQKPPKKPYRSAWRMTLEDGRARYPDGHPDLTSKETRQIAESTHEQAQFNHRIEPNPPGPPPNPGANLRK